MNKPPAFQFYPKDWFDYKVMRMSYEAQGVYIRILSHMWKDSEDMCSFPKNVKSVCKILGISTRKWTKIYNELQKHHDPIFIENEHRFISKRLQGEAIKLMQYRELASKGGKKSAVKRWGKKGKGTYKGGYKGTGKGRVTLQSSSSSSSSSSNKEETYVWEKYKEIFKEFYKREPELTLKRKFHIKARLEKFTVDELIEVMKKIRGSKYHIGENPSNRFYATPDYCFRNNEQTENWLNPKGQKTQNKWDAVKQMIKEEAKND